MAPVGSRARSPTVQLAERRTNWPALKWEGSPTYLSKVFLFSSGLPLQNVLDGHSLPPDGHVKKNPMYSWNVPSGVSDGTIHSSIWCSHIAAARATTQTWQENTKLTHYNNLVFVRGIYLPCWTCCKNKLLIFSLSCSSSVFLQHCCSCVAVMFLPSIHPSVASS